jgi:hypothetical protein
VKVEWLNDDCTEARLTRGWINKVTTVVKRIAYRWFLPNNQECSPGLEKRLERAKDSHKERLRRAAWTPVADLPTAKARR